MKTPQNASLSDKLIIQGDTLKAVSPVYLPKPVVYGSIIDCLIRYESSGREDAVGDGGKAYGVLQFWESTFNQYKKKYNMEWLEYTSANDQKLLADKMLSDGLGYHWTTIKFCK